MRGTLMGAFAVAFAGVVLSASAANDGYENGIVGSLVADGVEYAGRGDRTTENAKPTAAEAKTCRYARCGALSVLDLSDVAEVGDAAFAYSSVVSVSISSNVASVGYISFGGCTNLEQVAVQSWSWAENTSSIDAKEPFRGCDALATIVVSGDAALPPSSFSVTNVFPNLAKVRCPEECVEAWMAACPGVEVSGDVQPGTSIAIVNGTPSIAFSATSQDDADEIATSSVDASLTAADVAAGMKISCLKVAASPVTGASGYYYAALVPNPDSVPRPSFGASSRNASPIEVAATSAGGMAVVMTVTNAVQGLWYGIEACDSIADGYSDDVDSFRRALADGAMSVTGSVRTATSGFFRVKVSATKPSL